MVETKNQGHWASGDFLNRFAVQGASTISSLQPGFEDGPHPMLTFLLRTLNGTHEILVAERLGVFLMHDPALPVAIRGDFELFLEAVDSYCGTLREMADMWVASGKSGADCSEDTPADRNVEDVPPGFEVSLFVQIDRLLLVRYPRHTAMRRDGTMGIKDTFPRLDAESASFRFGTWETVLQDYGQMWAAYDFSRLLDSPYSKRISRCDVCRSYFVYDRNRLRTVKHGVFCPACKGKASVIRTENSRNKRIATAAEALAEWEALPESKSRRHAKGEAHDWVTKKVNEKHGTDFGKRWFTQNKEKVQAKMEEMRNAKG